MEPLTLTPIGVARSPFLEKAEAPRQATVGGGHVEGRIELLPEHLDALDDVDGFDRLWILFWFHEAGRSGARKVLPPRSLARRGVFATRSPHRPNPIGLTCVRLLRVEGSVLHVRDLDLVDGTPVIDVKPYLPYADAFPDAKAGWLEAPADPGPPWTVVFAAEAEARLAWLDARGVALRPRVADTLALGPQPHAYRRIKPTAAGPVLAVKEWRFPFSVEGRVITVNSVATGFVRDLGDHALHRAFVSAFPSKLLA